MNNFTLISIGSCYFKNANNIITISEYKNKTNTIFTIEYETLYSWDIEWFNKNKDCNDLHKIIEWLNMNGSSVKKIESELCLLGIDLNDLEHKTTTTTNTYEKTPFNNNYIFDYDIFDYTNVISIKEHLNIKYHLNDFDELLK